MGQAIEAHKARTREIGYIGGALRVLEWDQQTYMPPGGARARAEQIGHLSRLAHEQFTAPETGRLLEAAESEAAALDRDSDDAALVRVARRDYDRMVKIPTDLAAEMAQHAAISQSVWREARAKNDFPMFAPNLRKTVELSQRVADLLGYEDDPYDALLDGFEPGMKTREVAAIFDELKPRLVALTRAIKESGPRDDQPITGHFPIAQQAAVTLKLCRAIGYDLSRGRQDQAPHPFCTNFSRDDVRITTRYSEEILDYALFASLHETGHALYEQGVAPEYENTDLAGGTSMGVHESQSRLWENLVGRSRPFSEYAVPILRDAYPDAFAGVTPDRFWRSVNHVEPSLIRVEADEVTYNLHILLRFELEREMLDGRQKADDLPGAWNERMEAYLGITPPTDALGVLQDIHWSGGMLGYFPTYTIGNLLAAQLWHSIRQAIPDLDAQIQAGKFDVLLGWLREHVHRFGRKYLPGELIPMATGEPLTARYYIQYLESKFRDLYCLS